MYRLFLFWKYFGWIFIFILWKSGKASSKNQIFSAYQWSPVSRDYTNETTLAIKGTDVQLRCKLSDTVASVDRSIRRLNQSIELNQTSDILSTRVALTNVTCNEQGTYVCERGKQKEMLDLGITNCGPKPCENEANPKSVYAKLNAPKSFSVCIVVYNMTKMLNINNKTTRENETNSTWTWKSTYKQFDNLRHYLNFTVMNVSSKDYKTYNITLTSQTADSKITNMIDIEFKEPVNPACPTNIKVTRQSTDFVTLSWQLGDPGADNQSFYVYYNCESCGPWKAERTGVGDTSVTISNLIQNKHYIVRLEPHNSENLVNTNCQVFYFNTVVTTSASTPKPTTSTTFAVATDARVPAQATTTPKDTQATTTRKDKNSDSTDDTITSILPIIIILGVLAILAVPVAILGICMYCRLKRVYSNLWNPEISRSRRNVRYIPEGSLQTTPTEPVNESLLSNQSSDNRSGRSVSQDGLIYVTVDHSNHRGRPLTNSSTRKGDKVEYAGLDYKYSGKLPMSCSDDTYVNC